MREFDSHRIIPMIRKNQITLDRDFMKKTKGNGTPIPQTLRRKTTLNDDLATDTDPEKTACFDEITATKSIEAKFVYKKM